MVLFLECKCKVERTKKGTMILPAAIYVTCEVYGSP